jgi:phage FluMu protein Com
VDDESTRRHNYAFEIDTVRCLGCGAAYIKPLRGGTVHVNPGCPRCGYVGWVLASRLTGGEPRRFVVDPPQQPAA